MSKFDPSRAPGETDRVPGNETQEGGEEERSALIGQLFTIPGSWRRPTAVFGLVLQVVEHSAVILLGYGVREHSPVGPGEIQVSPAESNGLVCTVRFAGAPRCRSVDEIARLVHAGPVGNLDCRNLQRVRTEVRQLVK